MAKKKSLYPGVEEAERQRDIRPEEEPDFIGGAPNYDKFENWEVERVLAWLNID